MNEWIIISLFIIPILVLIAIVIAFVFWKRKKEELFNEPDYRVFFIMGICFIPIGIIFSTTINFGFMGFIALGLIYIAIGLSNRDKWEKKEE